MQFLYKVFLQNKMLCRPTIPSFSELKPETHIYIFFGLRKPFSVCIVCVPVVKEHAENPKNSRRHATKKLHADLHTVHLKTDLIDNLLQ